MNNILQGCRGYIGSREYDFGVYPQHVQNMVIRNFCQKYDLTFLLSATEYAMPGCYMILNELINNIEFLDGIVLFSIFMLPRSKDKRMQIYQQVLNKGKVLYGALEDVAIRDTKDVESIEVIFGLSRVLSAHNNNILSELIA